LRTGRARRPRLSENGPDPPAVAAPGLARAAAVILVDRRRPRLPLTALQSPKADGFDPIPACAGNRRAHPRRAANFRAPAAARGGAHHGAAARMVRFAAR